VTAASRLAVVLAGVSLAPLYAQRSLAGETEIRLALDRLNTLGSVMMIAAHPDDENTALLAYFARGRNVRTGYLALTRGEGGQNLIGSEQGDELGIIRTQELLAARRIDGGEQFFTRAIDFGFTKTVEETLTKWPRDKVLGDVVWGIRRFRPDVIVLRFSGTPRDGHGHHQTSAILGKEAFTAAADPAKFPEQLQWVQPWQARRLMYNPGGFTAQQEREAAQLADRIEVDLGGYSPEIGYSYGEIAGMSRSQHRSQGMGAAERRGSQKGYLQTIAGDKATKDSFDGIDISWTRLPGGAEPGEILRQARAAFAPAHPEALLPALIKARPLIASIKDPLAERKLAELDETIALCAGLWVDASADKAAVAPGGGVKVGITALARVPAQVMLLGVDLTGAGPRPDVRDVAPMVLVRNQPNHYTFAVQLPADQPYSQPYWLDDPNDGSLYTVRDPREIGNPENRPVMEAHFRLRINGTAIELVRPVQHRYVDRVYGESIRPLAVVPPVALELPEQSLVFPDNKPRRIEVPVRANAGRVAGDVHLEAPEGWRVAPVSRPFELPATDEQTTVVFDLTPPSTDARGELRAVATVGERKISSGTEVIAYPHIPAQTLFPPAKNSLVRADIRTLAKSIGYIVGAGDQVPEALRQMGCEVTLLTAEDLTRGNLARFDAIVTGVRAFNTRADLRANYQRLFDYAQNGGTVVVQYNVPDGGGPGNGQATGPGAGRGGEPTVLDHVGPYPIRTSRERVTVEEAPVMLPNPQLSLLHAPNEIASRDFEGWVQERGLNFANEWDAKYLSVLESHDPGEKPLPGGMLYARLGKGAYIFSAYSWFRQLPAGVPGAYRLFANMMSAAKTQ
jgi:LmbE family N-acetylglucosaminyl deacetylase